MSESSGQRARSEGLDRLPLPHFDELTDEQKAAFAEFQEHRGMAPFGPFVALLRSPTLLGRVRALGDYLRYETRFPPKLSEFAILIVASFWRQTYEWDLHAPIALGIGVDASHVRALASGLRPCDMSDEEAVLYDFCTAVCGGHTVDDATYARVVNRFGERGAIEAVGLVGYYSLLAMVLNTARTPAPVAEAAAPPVPSIAF